MKSLIDAVRHKTHSLLRWSEKYTKTDMVFLSRGGFWLTLGQIFATFSSLFIAFAFAHFSTKEDYGNYKYVFSTIAVFSSFSLTGLGTLVSRSAARDQDGFLRKSFQLNLAWSAAFIALACATAIYYIMHGNYLLGFSLFVAGIGTPIISSANFYDPFLIGKKAFRLDTILNTISVIIPSLLVMTGIILFQNYFYLICIYFVSNVIVNLILYHIIVTKHTANNTYDNESIRYSKHLSLLNIVSTVANNIDQILLFHFLGAASVAIYAFARAVPEQIKGLLKNVSNLAISKFSQQDKRAIDVTMWRKVGTYVSGVSVITLIYIVAAPFIFKFIFPQYIDSLLYSQVYALSLIVTAGIIPTTALQAHSAKTELYKATVYPSLLQIAAVVSLTYFYGIWGAVISRIVIRLLIFIFSIRYWKVFAAKS